MKAISVGMGQVLSWSFSQKDYWKLLSLRSSFTAGKLHLLMQLDLNRQYFLVYKYVYM